MVWVSALLLAVGCQESSQPSTTLTQAQWKEVNANLLSTPPKTYDFPGGAIFGNKIELLGLQISPKKPRPGQKVTFTWYWKALAPIPTNYQVFGHFDHAKPPMRQILDHHPVRNLYQTTRWKTGQIVRDVQTVTLRKNYPGGEAILWAGLWDPNTTLRLPITNPTRVQNDGKNRFRAAQIEIDAPKTSARVAGRTIVARPLTSPLTLDGKLDDAAWKTTARTRNFGDPRGRRAPKGATWATVAYDKDKLYLGLFGQDTDVWSTFEQRDADTWTQEVFEIFIDPDGDGKNYLEIQVTPRNVIFDARFAEQLGKGEGSRREQIDRARAWNSTLQSAVHVDGTLNQHTDQDRAWSAEIAIPWRDIPGGQAKVKDAWKINFYRFDQTRDKNGKPGRQRAWAWSPAGGSFHRIDKFGTLRFLGASNATDIAPKLTPSAPSQSGAQPKTHIAPQKAASPMPEPKKSKEDEVLPDKPE